MRHVVKTLALWGLAAGLAPVARAEGTTARATTPAAKTKAAGAAPATSPTVAALVGDLDQLADDSLVGAAPAEKLYVVQDRARPMTNAFEIAVGGGRNLRSSVYVEQTQLDAELVYHWSDRFYTAMSGSKVFNKLTPSGERLWDDEGIYPDTAFVKARYDATMGFNLIYGKARMTRDSVFYFDQYLALGGGVVQQSDGVDETRSPAVVGDVGFALWFGRWTSARIGVNDDSFVERRQLSSGRVHHLVGYSSVGLVLGGSDHAAL
jgi:outer membrane beta-barrel protein